MSVRANLRLKALVGLAILASVLVTRADALAASTVSTNAGAGPVAPVPADPWCCDNLVSTDPSVRIVPGAIDVHPSGYVFATGEANYATHLVFRRGLDAKLTRLAGGFQPDCNSVGPRSDPAFVGDGAAGVARTACFRAAHGVSVLLDTRELVVSDTFHDRLRIVENDAGVRTIAGTGFNCGARGTCGVVDPSAPDPPNATAVDLCLPVAADPVAAGNDSQGYYIADHCNSSHQIRLLTASRKLVTSAGGLQPGWVDGPQLDARFDRIADIEPMPDGGYVVSDGGNCRIRLVRDGVVTTIAGSGATPCIPPGATLETDCNVQTGSVGDGGNPLAARLNVPGNIDVRSDGGIFVADQCNNRVRYIYPNFQKIITVAGTGEPGGWNGDGLPATQTKLALPDAVLVTALGGILVSDTANHRVRFVSNTPPPQSPKRAFRASRLSRAGFSPRLEIPRPEVIMTSRQARLTDGAVQATVMCPGDLLHRPCTGTAARLDARGRTVGEVPFRIANAGTTVVRFPLGRRDGTATLSLTVVARTEQPLGRVASERFPLVASRFAASRLRTRTTQLFLGPHRPGPQPQPRGVAGIW